MYPRIQKSFIPKPARLLPDPETHADPTSAPTFSLIPDAAPSVIPGQAPTSTSIPAQYQGKTIEELLAEARRQEKDKLYPQLEQLRGEVSTLTKAQQERESAEAEAVAEAGRLAEAARQAELTLEQRLAERETAMAGEMQTLRNEMAQRDALLERERQFQEVESYRQHRIREEQDNIIPELIDLVVGATPDEIEASIARLREKSASIIEGAAAATQQIRQNMPGTALTGQPPVGPLDTYTDSQSTLTADDIRNMPWAEYVKNRPKLLGAAGAQRDRGLFG